MSKLELINKYLKNTKLTHKQQKLICKCFAYDLTASKTSEKIGLSRQTINSHYKMLREFLIDSYQNQDPVYQFNKNTFLLKYININSQIIYYIEDNDTQIILDNINNDKEDILTFINQTIKDKLINHKKANTARILYHAPQEEYFISTFLNSENTLETYICNRLKKFRGLNKNNNMIHIQESIIRYNVNEEFLFSSLASIFRTK